MADTPLAGSRALVTGGGQGVGAEIVARLARLGAEVVVNDLSAARAEAVAERVRADGGRASVAVFDVTDWAAVQAAAAADRIDVLVNNAGNAGREAALGTADLLPFVETEPADWQPFLGVNLLGVMQVTRAFLPGMLEGGSGRIVTVVSDAGRVGEPRMAAYAAAKAGAAGFGRALAREVGERGVTVNCVSLGTIDTRGTDPERRVSSRYVVRRPGTPADVAGLVAFLCGPDAAWITGQTYPVNGGYSFAL